MKTPDQSTMETEREGYAKTLTDNGHLLVVNRIEGEDAVAFYCGTCGHGFALRFTVDAQGNTQIEEVGKSFEDQCAPPVIENADEPNAKISLTNGK
jgi:hypothetical protein